MLTLEIFDSNNRLVKSVKPLSLKLSLSINIPAHSLVAIIPYENYTSGETLFVYKDKEVIFKGIIDEEQRIISTEGSFIKLVARSLMGVLLDNEIEPVVLNKATSSFLGEKYLKPFSIPYDEGEDILSTTINGELGTTVYQVLSAFSNEVYSCDPYLSADGHFSFKGCKNSSEIYFSNSNGVKYNSFTEYKKPCEQISEIRYMMNKQGYCYRLINPETKGSSLKRVRYLDCRLSSETSVYDGEILMRNQNRESYYIKITSPFFLVNFLGSGAKVDIEDLKDKEFIVSEIITTFSSKGVSSEVTLMRKEDYSVAD